MDKLKLRRQITETLESLKAGETSVDSAANLIMFKLLVAEGESEPTLSVPDIRNKLSPVTLLVSLIERDIEDDRIEEMILESLPQVKESINYLAQRQVYPKLEK